MAPANGCYTTISWSWDLLVVMLDIPCNEAEGGMCFHCGETQGFRKKLSGKSISDWKK